MMRTLLLSIVLFLLSFCSLSAQAERRIDLSGKWKLFVDMEGAYASTQQSEIRFDQTIVLPSTLDEAKIGTPVTPEGTMRLARRFTFSGRAWYRKGIHIPKSWEGETKILTFERTKVTHVWVDNQYVGSSMLITTSQQYDLTPYLSEGHHTLTVMVDNGDDCGLPDVVKSSHQWSDDTQTNWNGMLGDIRIDSKPQAFIREVQVYPDVATRTAKVLIQIGNTTDKPIDGQVRIKAQSFNSNGVHTPLAKEQTLNIAPLNSNERHGQWFEMHYDFGNDALLWSEYTPNLYNMRVELLTETFRPDQYSLNVGLRAVKSQRKSFVINGQDVYLRGKHDGCVFPLTGYAPMDLAEWLRYFDILKSYGFNHVRFHSWCPPKAAFEAADLRGFYLQPELPIWGGVEDSADHPVNAFLLREGKAVFAEYGNHPSFVAFSMGNELWGSVDSMKELTVEFMKTDHRHLYAFGSNYHLGWSGEQGVEDFIVACRVGGVDDEQYTPHVRSSFSFADAIDGGLLNATYPNTTMNFNKGVSFSTKPVIAHETGQFQVYPDARELHKYTGVLYPHNLHTFIDRTTNKHGTDKVEQFFRASGALSLLCYKADIEMSLRTKDLAGYQMLDIQDFPGQGTALVGMLNAFMESKGLVTPEEFRSFNNEVVPLWSAESFTWYADEPVAGKVLLFNYPQDAYQQVIVDWRFTDESHHVIAQGALEGKYIQRGLAEVGEVNVDFSDIKAPKALSLELSVRGTLYHNSYRLWVYPRISPKKQSAKVKLFNDVDEALFTHLRAGKTAILMPTADAFPEQTVGGLFTNDYWNYSMFKTISENANKPISPGTLGYLIDHEHPLFDAFPTSYHSDWQWWAPARHARPLIMNELEVDMIVEAIDNVERNHKLGVMFECKVGKGRLFVCMSDLVNGADYKECNQLMYAIQQYVASPAFAPQNQLDEAMIRKLFSERAVAPTIDGVRNVSY